MNCFQRDSLKDMLRLSALHGNNVCTRNLGDRLRGCWQRKEWILSFLSLHTQRVLIHQNSSKILDRDRCVPQDSCLGQILFIMYVSWIFNGVKNHLPSIHAYAYDILCICLVCYTAVFSVVTQLSFPQTAPENRTTFLSRG